MSESRHWLTEWVLKNVRTHVRRVLKRSFFLVEINKTRFELTEFKPTKYICGHRDDAYSPVKQEALLFHKYYRKVALNREVRRIARKLIISVFPKNIESINRYKKVLPNAKPLLLNVFAKAADQSPEQLIINQLSYFFTAPSLSSLEQLQSENSTQKYFECHLKYNMKKVKIPPEKAGLKKSVKSVEAFFTEICPPTSRKAEDIYVSETTVDKIVLFDSTSSSIAPLSFKDSFYQFQDWLYLTNKMYMDFYPKDNISSEIKFLSMSELSNETLDRETQNVLDEFFKFFYRYPFIISSFFKYLMESSSFEFYDIHLYKLGLTITSEEICLFSDEWESDEFELDIFPKVEVKVVKVVVSDIELGDEENEDIENESEEEEFTDLN